jgi:catechol 2,3-dioxygenase-like lactoylglutathione lyase family enzyme
MLRMADYAPQVCGFTALKGRTMAISLNHTIGSVRDNQEAARLFARLFGLSVGPVDTYFVHVKLNEVLTLLFETVETFQSHHYAFHVSNGEFDAIFERVKAEGLAFGSGPGERTNGELNNWGGGRGFYFDTPEGHVLELMTVPQ